MRSLIHPKLSELIRHCLQTFMPSEGGRLCCDLESIQLAEAENSLSAIFQAWGRDHLLVLTNRGDKSDGIVVDMRGVGDVIHSCLTNEGTVSVIDLLSMGGATIDATGTNEVESIDVTIASWGEHEDMVSLLGKKHQAQIYRGN